MEKRLYPDDTKLREWILIAYTVSDSAWKAIDEYKSNIIGMAVPEVIRRKKAVERGIFWAASLVHDELEHEEFDVDDMMNAVNLFYLAAMETVHYMENEVKLAGEIVTESLRATAQNLLRCAYEWDDLHSQGFNLLEKGRGETA